MNEFGNTIVYLFTFLGGASLAAICAYSVIIETQTVTAAIYGVLVFGLFLALFRLGVIYGLEFEEVKE